MILGGTGLTFVLVTVYGIYHFFFRMNGLPAGEFVGESISPDGSYTVRLYESNPALSSGGTRGEVVNHLTGETRNIYWKYNRNLFDYVRLFYIERGRDMFQAIDILVESKSA